MQPIVPESVFGISFAKATIPKELFPPIITGDEEIKFSADEPDDDEEYYEKLVKDLKPMNIEVAKVPHREAKIIVI